MSINFDLSHSKCSFILLYKGFHVLRRVSERIKPHIDQARAISKQRFRSSKVEDMDVIKQASEDKGLPN